MSKNRKRKLNIGNNNNQPSAKRRKLDDKSLKEREESKKKKKSNMGIVYIASMVKGSKWPNILNKNGKAIYRVNVTSGSCNKINGISAKVVSPMKLGPVNNQLFNLMNINNVKNDDIGALLFENYWQYGKIFKDLGHLDNNNQITDKWKLFRKNGYLQKKGHRHPKGTKTNQVLYKYMKGNKEYNKYKYHIACSSYYFGEYMNYIQSRKNVYAPMYELLVKETEFYKELSKKVRNGMDVMILDYDGPRGNNQNETCLEVNIKMLKEKINDSSHPFGHGYIFAAIVAGIEGKQYCF